MNVFHAQSPLNEYLTELKANAQTIGFVPTMGAIHDGHLSLLQQALKENDTVVMSIFVNPTQFNNQEDLEKYPRTFDRDVALVHGLSDKIIIFAPTVEDVYGKTPVSQKFDYDGLEKEMEGRNRPGHFDGVGTIVKKLFEIVQPDRAYFGEKDFQQLQIIRKMVDKNHMNIEIIGCPIFRQPDGLAMSSRNERLSSESKIQATAIYKILREARNLFEGNPISSVIAFVENEFKKLPDFKLEYFVIADEATLKSSTIKEEGKKYRGFAVAHINGVRLIDNIALN